MVTGNCDEPEGKRLTLVSRPDTRAPLPPATTFTVMGIPAPKGSKRAYPYRRSDGTVGVSLVEASRKLVPWREAVRTEVLIAKTRGAPMYSGPVHVELMFFLPRPKRPRSTFPITRPDLDKLARAVLDELTGVLISDDSIVVELWLAKRYARHTPGVKVHLCQWASSRDAETSTRTR